MIRWTSDRRCFVSALLIATVLMPPLASPAQSAIDLLGRFDRDALSRIDPQGPPAQRDELIKLLDRLSRIHDDALRSRVSPDAAAATVGDAALFGGRVALVQPLRLPDPLSDVLEIDGYTRLRIAPDLQLFVAGRREDIRIGDEVRGVGVLLHAGDEPHASDRTVVAGKLSWTAKSAGNPSWQVLADAGLDVALLQPLRLRNRSPLTAADHASFFGMLAAAARLGRDRPSLPAVGLTDLLADPESQTGNFTRLDCELIRVTPIALPESSAAHQLLSRDQYYQIDAMCDLGNLQIKIQPLDPAADALTFDNRFPVSIVTPEDPGIGRVGDGGRRRATVEGFFYRLWAYDSDLSRRNGSTQQLGPLIVATDVRLMPVGDEAGGDPIGVSRIGWVAAAAVVAMIIAMTLWSMSNRRADRRAKRDRGPVDFPFGDPP